MEHYKLYISGEFVDSTGGCVKECGLGMYGADTKCEKCPEGCSSCNAN